MPTTAPLLHSRLSASQVTVLRKLVRDPQFRTSFLKDPAAAGKASGLNATEISAISKVNAQEIDGLQRAVKAVGGNRADDSCTLVYALAFAVALALILADVGLVGGVRE